MQTNQAYGAVRGLGLDTSGRKPDAKTDTKKFRESSLAEGGRSDAPLPVFKQ